jgi:hypothetical protein
MNLQPPKIFFGGFLIHRLGGVALPDDEFAYEIAAYEPNTNMATSLNRYFASAAAVAAGIKSQRVTALDVWGSTHTVDLGLKTVTQ